MFILDTLFQDSDHSLSLFSEEAVRQLYIYILIHNYGYSTDQMELERNIHFGREVKRADIVIFEKSHPNVEYIIVEVKKPKLSEGKEQLKSYCNATGATMGVWTNGQQISFYHRKDPNYFEDIPNIPTATQKLKDILTERWTIDDLVAKDKLVSEKKSLKGLIEEMEDEVLSNAGVDVFEEVFKLIYTKLYDEMESGRDYSRTLRFRNYGDTDEDLKANIQALFEKAKEKWPGVFSADAVITLTASHLAVCVSSLQDVKLFNSNLDVVDDAFEYLMSKSQKGEKGQYFTPRYVIDMCVRMLNPKRNEKMIDTAAGSCGFPAHTIFYVWKQILAEKGISQSHLFTAEKKPPECEDYVRKNVFAIDFDEKAVRVARALNLIAGDGRTNVMHLNTLDYERWDDVTKDEVWQDVYFEGWSGLRKMRAKKDENRDFAFDILMANPPFAGDIKESRIIAKYELGKNVKGKYQSKVGRDILFIERNLSFLKPGGRMAIVLPQGRFNNSSDKYIRDFIAEHCRILAVVGLHGNVFKPHTGTKTSVLFVQKWDGTLCPKKEDYPIFFATMQKPSKDNSGEKIYRLGEDGRPLLDEHGHMIVDHDLFNHDGLTEDGIAEAFAEFAKKEGLSFFSIGPSTEPFNEARYRALMDGLECSKVMLSSLERTLRIDAEFYQKSNLKEDALLSTWEKLSFTDCFKISDGNHMSISESFCDNGIPYYRGQDTSHLFIEQATPYRIDKQAFAKPQMHRSHLRQGDVLVSIVGTIGNSSLVTTNEDSTCSCKLAIMRPKGTAILSEMLLVYIKTKYGQGQIQKFKRGAVQTGLLLEDFDQLYIPAFNKVFQSEIRDIIQATKAYQESAEKQYRNAESILLHALNYQPIEQTENHSTKTFSESFGLTGRLDAEYYQPKYDEYLLLVKSFSNGYVKISDVFSSVKTKCIRDKESYRYVEIGDIDIESGMALPNEVETCNLPDNAKIMTSAGDILVSTVRPNRGAVAILEGDKLLVSGAFTVLRQSGDYPKEVLQVLLRTQLYRDWLLQTNVGTSYPVIKDADVLNLLIPIFADDVNLSIIKKVQESFSLRSRSERLLENAKHAVELAIEQGEDEAMKWLQEQDCTQSKP